MKSLLSLFKGRTWMLVVLILLTMALVTAAVLASMGEFRLFDYGVG